ncbi:hypothetical protein [Nocardioides panaciterrulae]|uniref:Integral membrane protein n=1 Tax=Nocardioides panaciterrulae TaxID=661492 RepID=A0A7Y9JC35_9ACTN|nr:hypothetical protein [Nocardioides panaciterrulae]NYD41859.1 hypothetical protein [Nocardioides panaciterrulae]
MGEDELERSELEAVLQTRHELGASYDAALVDSFAERIEREVQRRATDRFMSAGRPGQLQHAAGGRQLALGIVSVVAAVPISIPLGLTDHLPALLVSWAGLVGVNLAHALQARPRA